MEPFVKHTGLVAPLDRVNVDTDQMVPKQFLKFLTREGYGRVLFYDWRYLPGEKLDRAASMRRGLFWITDSARFWLRVMRIFFTTIVSRTGFFR